MAESGAVLNIDAIRRAVTFCCCKDLAYLQLAASIFNAVTIFGPSFG